MPLVEIFAKQALRISASELHFPLCKIWKVPGNVLKVLVVPVFDHSALPGEDVYISVRAKSKPDRTKEAVEAAVRSMSNLFFKHGLAANIRVELYEGSLQTAFWEGPVDKAKQQLGLNNMSDVELRDLFVEIDENKDGIITTEELLKAMARRGIYMGSASDDGDSHVYPSLEGQINLEEFLRLSQSTE